MFLISSSLFIRSDDDKDDDGDKSFDLAMLTSH